MKKAVFVTGGTVGSGLAIAERFAKEGYAVIITSRGEERAQEAARGGLKSMACSPRATVWISAMSSA